MNTVPRLGLLQLAGREAPALYVIGLLFAVIGAGGLVAGVAGAGVGLALLALVFLGAGGIALSGASALQRRVDTPVAGWRGPVRSQSSGQRSRGHYLHRFLSLR